MKNIRLIMGDITKLEVDALVNAANSSLMGGGGVDGAIHRAAGPSLDAECRAIIEKEGSCPTGHAVITLAGKMAAKYVIHTVGPVWHGGSRNEEVLLGRAYSNSLSLAVKSGCASIAFPNISTGVYGFPKLRAAEIAFAAVNDFLGNLPPETEMDVVFCCFDEENFQIYKNLLGE